MHERTVKGVDVALVVTGAVPVIVGDKVVVQQMVRLARKFCAADERVLRGVQRECLGRSLPRRKQRAQQAERKDGLSHHPRPLYAHVKHELHFRSGAFQNRLAP